MSLFLKIKLVKPLLYATARMAIQLILIGFFLKYLFAWNNPYINMLWLLVMITTAVFSAIKHSSVKINKIIIPVLASFTTATLGVIFYLNIFVIRPNNIFDVRYLVILSGMLLGNSLRGNIIGINTFYKTLKSDNKRYLYTLALGATKYEALLPYLRESVQLALRPSFAAMATMGIVALPGMMTGVILGGTSPEVAIKYQIMIMIGIVTSTIISVVLSILTTMHICFNQYGILRNDVFSTQ